MTLRYTPAKFTVRQSAFNFASKCLKPHFVVLGDDMMFWVVCFADAQRLVKNGYEIAK